MADKDFIVNKLLMMKKDKQDVFDKLVEPLQKVVEKGNVDGKVKIPIDGNWFNISFDAIEAQKNRLVISAKRVQDGLVVSRRDPAEKEYIVDFLGTRAAYLRGFYKPSHPVFCWPSI